MSMPAEILQSDLTLQQLLAGFVDAPPLPIAGIADDSRQLQAGDVFLAWQGAAAHGLKFTAAAIEAGATAIVWDADTGDASLAVGDAAFFAVEGLAGHLGEIANRWYDRPSRAVKVIGVTGTNGKTTVASMVAQCLQKLGSPCAYIGTLGSGFNGVVNDLGMTTPPCLELQRQLATFRDAGASHVALEVSSHALVQGRVDGVQFDAVIFTNLSRDHIDYHGDMRAYGEAKARLFTACEARHRIINVDSEFGQDLAGRCGSNVVTVSTRFDRVANGRPYVFVRSVVTTPVGSRVTINSTWGNGDIEISLPGDFNVANVVAVLALLLSWNISLADACEVVGQVKAPPGRMQMVAESEVGTVPTVFVDYAHTPAALEAALRALRPHTKAKIWCVFGCGGDRDRGKRPQMGKIASRLADRVIVTNDNPRSEAAEQIMADILGGMDNSALAIENRATAIARAIHDAEPGDVIFIAGKGHEDYQLIADERLDFSDYEVVRANINKRLKEVGDP
ncbi:MAG: UDP-N-acetylmuramoyl-L-alanyl-D-glutamate--2,6-diaminopimelate ligase [Proteobacteria bacterium]|nr:UDP-N-acetylmuramoyl-L-alanyl-D-glutamate--2,6-diaminopimelate ligase [Pseudomonadota bacterium]